MSRPPAPAGRRRLALLAVAASMVAGLVMRVWLTGGRRVTRTPPRPVRRTEPPVPPRRSRSLAVLLALLVVGLSVVLGVAPLSLLAGAAEPPVVAVEVRTGAGVAPVEPDLRDVPAGLPAGTRITSIDDVRPYAARALGEERAGALLGILGSAGWLNEQVLQTPLGGPDYPFRYPVLETLLGDAAPAEAAADWTRLGAALTLLTAQKRLDGSLTGAQANAGPAAFAVLRRAVEHGGCASRLNLLLVVAGEVATGPAVLADEQRAAEAACPGDVTPGWLVGQAQLRLFTVGRYPENPEPPTATAVAAMERLVDRFPTSVAALTGLGDAHLAAAMSREDGSPPFAIRHYLRQAVAAYNRAVDHGGAQSAAVGLARALLGLGEPLRAIDLLTPAAQTSATPGPVLEVLIAAQEAAGRFADAEQAARRLADLGPAAYPQGTVLVPMPQRPFESTLADVTPALSLGAARMQPLRSWLWPEGGAGGSLVDNSFVPAFRPEAAVTGTHAACAEWTWRRNAILAGHTAAALAGWGAPISSARPDGTGCDAWDLDPKQLRSIAELLMSRPGVLGDPASDTAADAWQNLLRWAGDRPRARAFVLRWEEARGEQTDLPARRGAELDFLDQRYDEAAAGFLTTARRSRLARVDDDLAVAQAELGRAAAQLAAGRAAEAEPTLRRLRDQGTLGVAYQNSISGNRFGFAFLAYHASAQLADEERRTGRLRAAAEGYDTALTWFDVPTPGLRIEVLHNNAALAHLGIDDLAGASELITKALREDPHNPVTLMTAGFIADRRGDVAGAERFNRAALTSDPGLYPAANDLGVQAARLGRTDDARAAFRQAVGARPDYALGWFNLGVLESAAGPERLLAAQHALGTAYGLDPDLRDDALEPAIDGQVYRTALDLSKPLPPAWTFADLTRPAPAAAVGLLAVAGIGLGLAKAAERGDDDQVEKWFDAVGDRIEALPLLNRIGSPLWAIAATLLAFFLATLTHEGPAVAVVPYLAGLLVIVLTAVLARRVVAARLGLPVTQRSWRPSIVVGVAAGAFGYPWAPLPVLAEGEPAAPTRVHLAAPLTLAAVTLVLFVEAAWTHAPLVQSWAVATLIMCASVLLPVGPLDGTHLSKAGTAMGAGVVGAALLYALDLI